MSCSRCLAVAVTAICLLAVAMQFANFHASAAPVTTLTISEPKHTSSHLFVSLQTEFSISVSETADIWYRWGSYNYTKYVGTFIAEVQVGNPGGPPGIPIELEGLQTLYYNATGEAPKSVEVWVDILPPSTEAQFTGPNHSGDYVYITSDTSVGLSASDLGAGLASTVYSINGGPASTYTAPFKVPGSGPQVIAFYSLDNLGNAEAQKTESLYIDDMAPTVIAKAGLPNVTAASGRYINRTTPLTFAVVDPSGWSSIAYSVDGGQWNTYTGSFTLEAEGSHQISYKAIDNLGHESPAASSTFIVDSTPPTVGLLGSSGGSVSLNLDGSIVLSASDAGSGDVRIFYRYSQSMPWTLYSVPLAATSSGNISFYAVDALENKAAEQTVSINVMPLSGDDDEPVSWRVYAGVALIIGGILVAISSFFIGRKGEKPKKARKKDMVEKKDSKKSRRNR